MREIPPQGEPNDDDLRCIRNVLASLQAPTILRSIWRAHVVNFVQNATIPHTAARENAGHHEMAGD
jgi:hypothetical protein